MKIENLFSFSVINKKCLMFGKILILYLLFAYFIIQKVSKILVVCQLTHYSC